MSCHVHGISGQIWFLPSTGGGLQLISVVGTSGLGHAVALQLLIENTYVLTAVRGVHYLCKANGAEVLSPWYVNTIESKSSVSILLHRPGRGGTALVNGNTGGAAVGAPNGLDYTARSAIPVHQLPYGF